jgi:hypothetical protein
MKVARYRARIFNQRGSRQRQRAQRHHNSQFSIHNSQFASACSPHVEPARQRDHREYVEVDCFARIRDRPNVEVTGPNVQVTCFARIKDAASAQVTCLASS